MHRELVHQIQSSRIERRLRAVAAWRALPVVTRVYVATVSAIGFACVAWSLPVVAEPDYVLLAVLFVLSIPISLVKVRLPRTASTLTVSHVLAYLALLTLGTRAAVLVAAVGGWSQCTFHVRQRLPAHQTLFSIASLALAMQSAGAVYLSLGGKSGGGDASSALVPFAAAATVFFLLNSGLVAGAIRVTTTQSLGRLWCETFLPTWPAFLLGAALAGASVFAMRHDGPWLVLLLAIPFAVAFHNLRAYLERVDEAATDALTALPNQRYVLAHAERELARAKRRGAGMTIVICDVDEFKSINDTYGHRAGDLALRQVAACLQGSLRSHDVCARYGGDEFLVVLSDCGAAQGEAKARELQIAVDALKVEVRPTVNAPVGISVGAAAYPEDDESLERLLEMADARMYRNKMLRARTARFNVPPMAGFDHRWRERGNLGWKSAPSRTRTCDYRLRRQILPFFDSAHLEAVLEPTSIQRVVEGCGSEWKREALRYYKIIYSKSR